MDYTSQIRTFGAVGYSPERIANILNLKGHDREEFLIRITTENDPYYQAWINGQAIGEWNIDAELAKAAEKGDTDAIELQSDRARARQIKDLRLKMFGV